MYVFHLYSTIKVRLVDKMKQSNNLSVILRVKHEKLAVISVFPVFYSWVKSKKAAKMVTMFSDVIIIILLFIHGKYITQEKILLILKLLWY